MSLLEKSLALQVQEVTCELQGTRLGGRPDALLYIPASVARTAVSSQHRQQSRAPHTGVAYSNVILDTAVQCSPPPPHTHSSVTAPQTTMQCAAHTGAVPRQQGSAPCAAVPSALSRTVASHPAEDISVFYHSVVTFP